MHAHIKNSQKGVSHWVVGAVKHLLHVQDLEEDHQLDRQQGVVLGADLLDLWSCKYRTV